MNKNIVKISLGEDTMKKPYLSVFVAAMMNVALVMSLRGLPLIAKEGLTMIFYIAFASLLFLLPVSLVSAELATGWPKEGGVYRWVKEAFGSKYGFAAIWLQWIQNTVWYTTVLAFAAGTISYVFLDQSLANNKLFVVAVILIVYWGATFVNFRGLKAASWLTTLFVIMGTLVPVIFIIILGLIWILNGNELMFLHSNSSFFPDFANFDKIAFLAGTVLLFAGMEVGAVHVVDMKKPKVGYPKAVFLALGIIITAFLLGAVAIGAVLPIKDISLTVGIMQGFEELLTRFGIRWLVPIVGFLVTFGALGGIIAWIGGPSKGLLATAKNGELPRFLQYTNKFGIQTHILWVQGIIVTVLAFVFLLIPNVSGAYFLLTALTVALYLVMYVLLYLAAIRLRYSQPKVERAYKIPGGKTGMWIVSGVGLLAVLFAFIVSFFPPSQLETGNPVFYTLFLIAGVVLFVAIPFVIHYYKRPSWKVKTIRKAK